MNIHRAGEGGGFGVVEPPVVGLPTVWSCDDDDVAGAFVVEVVAGTLVAGQNLGDARAVRKKLLHFLYRRAVAWLDEDVGELVIDERPGAAGGHVEMFAVGPFADMQQAGFADDAIG